VIPAVHVLQNQKPISMFGLSSGIELTL
jgi:hypothetical protein